jgi:glutaredoxin
VYTMKGCPFCDEFKTILESEKIDFVDRDIHENEEEYNLFSEIIENEFIPAILIIEEDKNGKKHTPFMYAPERDYENLTEAKDIIKNHIKKII